MANLGTGRYRYRIFAMVVLMSLCNYIDRGAIAFASSPIIELYGFNKIAWGHVLGYFGYGYMFGALVGGALADRLGPRRVWLWVGGGWSLFEIATAFAGDFGLSLLGGSALAGFAVIRIAFGFAEGPAYSLINKTMANWATPKERSFAVSLGLLGVPLGAMLSAPISVGLILMTGNWRAMFVVLGVVSLLLVLVLVRMLTDRPDANANVSPEEVHEILGGMEAQKRFEKKPKPWTHFFRSRTLLCNTVGYFSFQYVNFMILTWVPTYLHDHFHFNLSALWYVAMIPWLGPCVSVLLGGRFSDWLLRRTGKIQIARGGLASVILLLTTVTFLTISQANNAVEVIALLAVGNTLNYFANPVFWTIVIDTEPESTGTFSGIMHMFVNLAAVIAPILTGYLSQRYGYSSMFLATAIVTFVGMLAMLNIRAGSDRKGPQVVQA